MDKIEKLLREIEESSKEYKTESYSMSIGELVNLYKNGEIVINPEFQRYFRWSNNQKTKLIESILLGIPIPYIYVYQKSDGKWELVDGLQRVSSILQFMEELKEYPPLVLDKTRFLPSFQNFVWENGDADYESFPDSLKLAFKRSRINLTIIHHQTGEDAKLEVFKRLNTGGAFASDQEIRNATLVMENKDIYDWFEELANYEKFLDSISITKRLQDEQYHFELVLRYLACSYTTYSRQDVKDYLDEALDEIINSETFDYQAEKQNFFKLFTLLSNTLGEDTFKKFNGEEFKGKFLESAYEVITVGLGHNIEDYQVGIDEELIKEKIQKLWSTGEFVNNMGSGSNASSRLPKLIPFSKKYFEK